MFTLQVPNVQDRANVWAEFSTIPLLVVKSSLVSLLLFPQRPERKGEGHYSWLELIPVWIWEAVSQPPLALSLRYTASLPEFPLCSTWLSSLFLPACLPSSNPACSWWHCFLPVPRFLVIKLCSSELWCRSWVLFCSLTGWPEIGPLCFVGGVRYSWICGDTWTWIFKPSDVWTCTYMEDSQKTRAWSKQRQMRVDKMVTSISSKYALSSTAVTRRVKLSDLILPNFHHVVRERVHFLQMKSKASHLSCTTLFYLVFHSSAGTWNRWRITVLRVGVFL